MRRPWLIGFAGTLALLLAALIVWSQVSLLGELVVRNLTGQDWGYITDQDGRIVTILPREREHHRNPWDKSEDLEVADGPLNGLIQLHAAVGLEMAEAAVPVPGLEPGTVFVAIHQEAYSAGSGSTVAIATALRGMGIEHITVYDRYLLASVPIAQLEEVANLQHVQYLEAQFPFLASQGNNAGLQAATPPQTHGAATWHQDGYGGHGVKVGIIDVGFVNYALLESAGVLPAPAGVFCFDSFLVSSSRVTPGDCPARGKHGTAVAEAVINTAPDASLYLVQLAPTTDLRAAVDWLVDQDVDIINMSLGFAWDGPGDGTSRLQSSPLRLVDAAVNRGLTWINAAGNANWTTWFGLLNTDPQTHDHLFPYPPPAILDRLAGPPHACSVVVLPEEQPLTVFLRWDDSWPGASLDLDIYVYDLWTGKKIWGIGGGERQRAGKRNSIPMEKFKSIASLPAGEYCLHIHNASAAHSPQAVNQRPWIQLQLWGGSNYLFASSGTGSIANPAESANPGLLAVGAALYDDPDLIAHYSSRGPTTDGRIKPDVVGVAGFHSNAYQHPICQNPSRSHPGLCPFPGTSQASPHVAGLAALAKQRLGLPPAQLVEYLLRNTVARPGSPDHIWGQGLAQLPDSSQSAGEESDPTPRADAPAPTPVSATGDGARSEQPCPAHGPSTSLECDKQILLAVRDTLRGTNMATLVNWQASKPVADFTNEYGNGEVWLDGAPPACCWLEPGVPQPSRIHST
ncbi:MAG: S8 family serine peptidase [Caldilineaceae bacterium SB0662_bin_9]|uniref:S8 family serine peptidase n=1 Tax=Caldilineaceae bacterium SB0662_bin_9 TaxID=2605258 RepID=A0A6B1DR97_9CHLR|nr:S8 family serine peptidase [Caldilineaceae bacterium SB0662_bin_9]